jgi:hypothetical protein
MARITAAPTINPCVSPDSSTLGLILGSGVTVGVGIEVAAARVVFVGKLRAESAKNAIRTPKKARWYGLIGKDFMQIFVWLPGVLYLTLFYV